MWALIESNSISKIYTHPTSLLLNGLRHPANIFNLWSEAELKAIGIYPVTTDTTNRKSSEWYTNTIITYTFDSDNEIVTGTYGTATTRKLDDTLWTQADSDLGQLPEGTSVGDSKGTGLKTIKKNIINDRAGSLLQKYDWYTLRAASGGTAIPSAVTTYQAAVRTKANEMQTLIDNAANVDTLAALYVYNSDSPPTRPLGEFPDAPTI